MQRLADLTRSRALAAPVLAGGAVLALSLGACADDGPGAPGPGGSDGDPVAGVVDDCGLTVSRDLYALGLPANGRGGSATSFYDPVPDASGASGFYPLALSAADTPFKVGHQTEVVGGQLDPRCGVVDDTVYFDTRLGAGVHLDPARYPEGEARISVGIDLRFGDVAFPRSPEQIPVPLDPSTRGESVVVATQQVMPSRMTLEVSYGRPISTGGTVIVQTQHLPIAFECQTAFPLEVSWQRSSHQTEFCARNDAGDSYCLYYGLHHAAIDCRLAIVGQTLTGVDGAQAAVDLAGSLTAIRDGAALTGARLAIDTVHLR